jgi:TonB family protein
LTDAAAMPPGHEPLPPPVLDPAVDGVFHLPPSRDAQRERVSIATIIAALLLHVLVVALLLAEWRTGARPWPRPMQVTLLRAMPKPPPVKRPEAPKPKAEPPKPKLEPPKPEPPKPNLELPKPEPPTPKVEPPKPPPPKAEPPKPPPPPKPKVEPPKLPEKPKPVEKPKPPEKPKPVEKKPPEPPKPAEMKPRESGPDEKTEAAKRPGQPITELPQDVPVHPQPEPPPPEPPPPKPLPPAPKPLPSRAKAKEVVSGHGEMVPLNALPPALQPQRQVAPPILNLAVRLPSQGGGTGARDMSGDPYLNHLRDLLERNRVYPPADAFDGALSRGAVYSVVIEPSGWIVTIKLLQSTGVSVLDEAARQMITGSEPLPPLPSDYPQSRAVITVFIPMFPSPP